MKTSLLAAALAVVALHAGAYDSPPVHRNRSGSINYAPRPGVFVVVAVDDHERTVRLQARNGVSANVVVADDVYDVSKLRPGDRVQVDFLVPNDRDEPLAAAGVWPLR